MALLENVAEAVFEEATGSWVLGIGALLVAPVALPVLRPLAKGAVKGGLLFVNRAREAAAEVTEQWSDLVAEARAEMGEATSKGAEAVEITHEGHQG